MKQKEPEDGSKFALIAARDAFVEMPSDFGFRHQLSDGTLAMGKMPVEIDTGWRELIGSLKHDSLTKANFVLMYSEPCPNPEILDRQHFQVEERVSELFHLLQLSGRCEYQGANLVVGSLYSGKSDVRRMSEVPQFYITRGDVPLAIGIDRLETAVKLYGAFRHIEGNPIAFKRVKRGLKALMGGLQEFNGEDRIHEIVRSLEALILPGIGRTKRDYVHRCQTFTKPSKNAVQILEEAYELRSMATHMNDWENALDTYPSGSREKTALLRTLQMERLACFCYTRLLEDADLCTHFVNEEEMAGFWKLPDDQRKKLWGGQIKL